MAPGCGRGRVPGVGRLRVLRDVRLLESSGTTTTPDWVFSLFLGAGMVALFAGLVWVGATPWAMFRVLPALALAAAVTSGGALVAMIASFEVTSSGPC